jgi:hypothetical protein
MFALRASALARRVAPAVRAASTVRFTKDHEYVKLDGKAATCGITDFAQTQLGDVVFVSLPAVGTTFKKGCVQRSAAARFSLHVVRTDSRVRADPLLLPAAT